MGPLAAWGLFASFLFDDTPGGGRLACIEAMSRSCPEEVLARTRTGNARLKSVAAHIVCSRRASLAVKVPRVLMTMPWIDNNNTLGAADRDRTDPPGVMPCPG